MLPAPEAPRHFRQQFTEGARHLALLAKTEDGARLAVQGKDGTVTAVVTVMTYGCQDGKARNFTSDRIMALAPSTTNPRDYIVTRDIRVASTQDQYSYTTLYSYNSRHNEPECA